MLFAIQFAIGAFCLAWFAFFSAKAERKPPSAGEGDKRLAFWDFCWEPPWCLNISVWIRIPKGRTRVYFFSSAFVLSCPYLYAFLKKMGFERTHRRIDCVDGTCAFYNMFHKSDFFFSLFDGLSLMGGIAFAFYYYLFGQVRKQIRHRALGFYQLATVAVVCSAFTLIFENEICRR